MTTFGTDLFLLVSAYGLALAVSFAGMPVLGQGAFVAIGAFGTAQLAGHGLPLGIAVLTAVVIAAVAGYLVGFAAARLQGASLALATWGLAWLAYTALVVFPSLSGGSQGLTRPIPAHLVSPVLGLALTLGPATMVTVGLVLAVVLAASIWRSSRGPWGLDWAALRTGPALADSLGVPVQRRRRAALSASAAIGAVGGAGTAILLGVVAPADYSPLLSLQLFVAVLVGGTATWWGPILGVALLAALPSTADAIASATGLDPLRARSVLTAVLLVAALALRAPTAGLAQRLVRRRRRAAAPQPHANVDGDRWPATGSLLTLDRVSAAYGALLALDGIDLTLVRGEVHAVIGPNGSGKSTVLRVATGVLAPTAGAVRIGAATAPRAGQAASRVRAGTGVVRTWQRTANLDGLDPRTQVAVGARARERLPGAGWRHLFATPEARLAAVRRRAHVEAALAVVGLAGATHGSTALDSAEQRVLQIARALATGAHGLLLDEPAAGMSAPQRQRLGELLRRLADRGLGVLLVEHDMRLVAAVADRVSVLVGGKVVAHGTPEQVRANPLVARAYLGSDG